MKKKVVRNTEYKKMIKERLAGAKEAFIAEFKPERIILFGSFARKEEDEDSSIDILIVAKTDLSFYERIKLAIRISDGDPPIEPLVYTPGEINMLLKQGEGFIDEVLKEGVLLYSK